MKILVISQHYYPENFRINDITKELVQRGHEVTVICGYPNYPEGKLYPEYKGKNRKKHKEEEIDGVKVIRGFEISRGNNPIKLFLNYYSVSLSMNSKAKKLKKKFDIVLINQLSPVMQAWGGINYAKKHKVPCLLYCYDLWPDSLAAGGIKEGSFIYKYYFKVSNKIYKSVDKILYTSKGFIDYFVKTHRINENKLMYLPQYSEDIFKPLTPKKNEKFYNYVFAGNIGKVQSVETIIKAANEIKNDNTIKIHIVGNGSNLSNCINLANQYNLSNVIFHGKHNIEKMPEFYKMADAMVLTLSNNKVISNTLPGKAQTYMAAGKPIIAAIDGEASLILKEAKCGLLCNAEDYKCLADLFLKFKTLDANQMSLNAQSYYFNNFRKEIFFERLLKYMEDN